jgi:hypothetical protein
VRTQAIAPLAILLAACATTGQTRVTGAGIGPISNAVSCAAEQLTEEGFTVTHRDDAGMVHAEQGTDRLEVRVVPGDGQRYVIEVSGSGSETARDAANEVVNGCGS